ASFADLAMIVLIFFVLVSANSDEKGLEMRLLEKGIWCPFNDYEEKNIFRVTINSENRIMTDSEVIEIAKLKNLAKKFIINKRQDSLSSDSPEKAIISLQISRGTNYETYIKVLNRGKCKFVC
ncbi:MAG: biopolymer transporter ExbD, partial [Bacteroidetes bacterium]